METYYSYNNNILYSWSCVNEILLNLANILKTLKKLTKTIYFCPHRFLVKNHKLRLFQLYETV